MQVYSKRELAKIVGLMTQGMTEAGFTGVKFDRADIPKASWDALMSGEEDDEDEPDPVDFSSEIVYHRVTTDQGGFGLWLQPYPTLDLCGTGIDIKAFIPSGQDPVDLPDGWCFVGMDEDVFKTLFSEFAKTVRKP